MPFCTKWHSCDSLFFVQFTAQLIAYRLPAFFVLLHKCHVLRGYINITVVAFFCGCVLIAEVPKNQKALVDMNGILPSALVHRPPKVITPTSRHAPRARLRQDKPPRAHIECAPTFFERSAATRSTIFLIYYFLFVYKTFHFCGMNSSSNRRVANSSLIPLM